jgi:hypothetical protein
MLNHLKRASVVCAVALSSAAALAQVTTADVSGNVTDASGAILPNATITIENLGTHLKQVQKSNGAGAYTFTFLQPGQYSISVEAPGFKHFSIASLQIEGGDHARADASMQVGEQSQTVQVTAQTPLLQADSSTVVSSINQAQTENLPLSQRNVTNLITYTVGANEASSIDGLSSGQRPDDRRLSSSFSVNGQDDVLNNQLIDGTDNNERIIGTVGVKPSVDSIQEVTVQTNEYAPEVGRTAGGVINVITKSGSNLFHGSVYEFFKNDKFNARNPFDPVPDANTPISPKSELRQNDFGASLGGPILRNRTFFFLSYEGFRLVQGALNPVFSTVPTLAEEQAGPQGIVSADPYTANLAVDPIAATLFKLYPAPNTGGAGATANNYLYDPTNTNFSNTGDVRVDHSFNQNNSIYGRVTLNRVNASIGSNLPNQTINGKSLSPGSGDYGYSGPAVDNATNYQLNYTHIFTPTLVLELKAAYTRINNQSSAPNSGTNASTLVGFPGSVNYGPQSTGLSLFDQGNNLATLGDSRYLPLQDLTNTFQYNGAVTKTIGTHIIKAGAALIRRQAREAQSADPNGNFSFSLAGDGTPAASLASFLVGAYTGTGRTVNLFTPDYRTWEPGFYVQDTWKVTPAVTLNYGARYDIYTPFTEAHNHISNFDPATNQLLVAGVNGVSDTAGIKTDYTNFSPRVGFAATVVPKTVLRGGFGLSFYPGNFTSNAALKNAPFTSVFAPTCASPVAVGIEQKYLQAGVITATQVQPNCAGIAGTNPVFDQGVPLPAAQTLNSPNLSFNAIARNFKSGMVEQFNFLVERQIGQNVLTLGYVGALGRHVPETLNDINVPNPANYAPGNGPGQLGSQPRPTSTTLPGLGTVAYYQDEGASSYNALQATFQRRYANGLSFQGNYTWAHALDDATGISNEGQEGWGNADPFNVAGTEYSNSDLDLRQRFVLTGTYELQYGKEFTGVKKALLAGYVFNEVYVWNTGNPFSITDNFTGFGNSVYAAGVGSGPDRPEQIAPAKLSHPSISEWFNPAAFVEPAPGYIPNTRRNNLYGPHFQHVDLSIFKDVNVTENTKAEFRIESYNLTNTPAYFVANDQNHDSTTNLVPACVSGTYNGAVCTDPAAPSSAFGRIVRTNPSYTPRNLQIAIKLLF